MYWTKIVRSFCKIVMVLGIIASIISGIVISDDSVLIGLVVIIGGSAVSVISISFIMMLSEMSLTLDEMNNKMYKITQMITKTTASQIVYLMKKASLQSKRLEEIVGNALIVETSILLVQSFAESADTLNNYGRTLIQFLLYGILQS